MMLITFTCKSGANKKQKIFVQNMFNKNGYNNFTATFPLLHTKQKELLINPMIPHYEKKKKNAQPSSNSFALQRQNYHKTTNSVKKRIIIDVKRQKWLSYFRDHDDKKRMHFNSL